MKTYNKISIFILILLLNNLCLYPKNPIKKIKINNIYLNVEVASTPFAMVKGLQGRKNLKENSGMLFIYKKNKILSFWMKNTFIPLSIAFIDENGIITQIENMTPNNTKTIESIKPCKYALEVNRGWFKDNNILIGTKIDFLN